MTTMTTDETIDATLAAHAHEDSQDGGQEGSHEHVTPVSTYLKVYGALLVLTAITVQVSILDLGQLSVAVAMAVAIVKASLVAAIFMHLKWAERFNVLVFVGSLLFIVLFFGFTMVDLQTRGALNPEADTLRYQQDQATQAREQLLPPAAAAPAAGASAAPAE